MRPLVARRHPRLRSRTLAVLLALVAALRDGGSSPMRPRTRGGRGDPGAASRSRCRARCGSGCRDRATAGGRARGRGPLVRAARSPRWPGRSRRPRPGPMRSTSRAPWRRSPAAAGSAPSSVVPHRPPAWCWPRSPCRSPSTPSPSARSARVHRPVVPAPARAVRLRERARRAARLGRARRRSCSGRRRELAARAAAAAAICVLVVALVLTGSRGGILATLVAVLVRAGAGGPPARARGNPRRGRRSRSARRGLRRQPADVLGQPAPALGGRRPARRC